MLIRARTLRRVIDTWFEQHPNDDFHLDATNWQQIDYLIDLTQLFLWLTNDISRDLEVSVSSTWNQLKVIARHLTLCQQVILKQSEDEFTEVWLQTLTASICLSIEKLQKYITIFLETTPFLLILLLTPPSQSSRYDVRWSGVDRVVDGTTAATLEERAKQEFINTYITVYSKQLDTPEILSNPSRDDIFQSFLSPQKVLSSILY